MSMPHTENVWIFDLPGSLPGEPTLAGQLTRNADGSGIFHYDANYASVGPALDCNQLRYLKRQATIRANERRGIPGIIADTGPDAWGEKVLEMDLGYRPDPLQALVHVRDDGVGNVLVGDPAKSRLLPPTTSLDEIETGIQNRLNGIDDPTILRHQALYLSPDTALGGGKPKASLLLDGEMWIAKFPDRGDPADLAFHEAAAMEMMRRIKLPSHLSDNIGGISQFSVAKTSIHTFSNGKSALLVKRFDRHTQHQTIKRFGFASARTVIGMVDSEPTTSYQDFAQAAKNWVPAERYKLTCINIWLRLAFNALIGNMDDHPRNHALLQAADMTWDLSPAYDVLPKITPVLKAALSMTFSTVQGIPGQVNKSGAVSAESLIKSSIGFGIETQIAKEILIGMAEQIQEGWIQVLHDIDAPEATFAYTAHTMSWVNHLHTKLIGFEIPSAWHTTKKSRSWQWKP